MTTSRRVINSLGVSLALGAAAFITGCESTTYQTRGNAVPSSFLTDASKLRAGKSGEAKLVYINPEAKFNTYTKIQLEPVVLVADKAKAAGFRDMPKEDQQAVVNYVDAKIREKLGKDYTFVTAPGPDVMKMRVAITEAKGATVILDTVSSILPPAVAVSTLKRVVLGTHTAVGKAGVEMELLDSVTGKQLAAGIDERAGRKYTFRFDKFKRYRTVDDAFDHWTTRLQERLANLQTATGKK